MKRGNVSNNIKFQNFKTTLSSFSQFKSCLTVQMYIVTPVSIPLNPLNDSENISRKGQITKSRDGYTEMEELIKSDLLGL